MTTNNTNSESIYAEVMNDLVGQMKAEAIRLAALLQLADRLKDGPKSVAELAEATGTHAPSLYRLLYALACCGYFIEVEPQVFAQTERSEVLRSDLPRSLRDYAIIHGEVWQTRPWEEALWTLQTGQPVFPKMFGKDLWHYFAEDDPAAGQRFNQAMSSQSRQSNQILARSYDFATASTIIDVGGGQGSLLETILQSYPVIEGILFDQASVIEMAQQRHLADQFAGRMKLMGGSFFEAIPPGADIYVLKQIIQDWDDAASIQILSNCQQAMKAGGRVLVIEDVTMPGKKIPPIAPLINLQLQLLAPGWKRTEAEHRTLFASSGLKLSRVMPTASTYTILEAVAL